MNFLQERPITSQSALVDRLWRLIPQMSLLCITSMFQKTPWNMRLMQLQEEYGYMIDDE